MAPFWSMVARDDKKFVVLQIPFQEELMTASLFFYEKLTCNSAFTIAFWVVFILAFTDLYELMTGQVNIIADQYNLLFIFGLCNIILWIKFIFGLWTQNPLFMEPWLILYQSFRVIEGIVWIFGIIKEDHYQNASFRLYFISFLKFILTL